MSTLDPRIFGASLAVVDGDMVLGPAGLETVEGLGCLAQDLGHRLRSVPGDLYWDAETGLPLDLYLEDDVDDLAVQRLQLEAVLELERDGRVQAGTATASLTQLTADTLALSVSVLPIDADQPLTLVVQLEAASP